jgi:hypothetical protein
MEKSREGMSLNYKINGEVNSFKTVDELVDLLKFVTRDMKEPLTVEPLDVKGLDYDHMQEIMERSWEIEACVRGIAAMAERIQETEFQDFNNCNMTRLALRSRDLLDEIMDIGEASEKIYESDRKAMNLRTELSKHKATG